MNLCLELKAALLSKRRAETKQQKIKTNKNKYEWPLDWHGQVHQSTPQWENYNDEICSRLVGFNSINCGKHWEQLALTLIDPQTQNSMGRDPFLPPAFQTGSLTLCLKCLALYNSENTQIKPEQKAVLMVEYSFILGK